MDNIFELPNYEFLLSQMSEVYNKTGIRTFSGEFVDVINPDPEKINIQDIAHALSHLCRYGGHTDEFYSVAQHSIAVSYLVPEEVALEGLLHDATEAYMVDLPRPIKKQIKQYSEMEQYFYRWAISPCFNLNPILPRSVHNADNAMIVYEWFYFMDRKPEMQKKISEFASKFFVKQSANEVKTSFLSRFTDLMNKR